VAYALAADARAAAYGAGLLAPRRLPVPVVSVGNVTWGGSGKTPLTEHLARRCLALGAPPLVLTRGYGRVRWLCARLPRRCEAAC
jgi:tetraacyldisaccharide 4'-kinase